MIFDFKTVLLLAFLAFVYLLIKYPDRLVFTHPAPPELPEGIERLPLIGATYRLLRRPPEAEDREMTEMFLWVQREAPLGAKDAGKREWPRTQTFPPFGRSYMCNQPEYVQHIQKDNFANFPKGKMFRDLFSDVLGVGGIFVSDDEVWKTQRKLASHIFSVGNFKNHVQTVIHKELDVLRTLFASVSDSGSYVNLQDIFFRFTLASFGHIAFDHGFDTLPTNVDGLRQNVEFARAFDGAQNIVAKRLETPGWKLWEAIGPTGKLMRRYVELIHGTAYAIVDERLRARELGTGKSPAFVKESTSDRDLLDLFIDHTKDRRQLMETILNFIIAGRDTTAQALSWQMWFLLNHPDVVARAQEEIASVLGKGEAQRKLEYDDVPKMPYLNAVFNETLRLQCPVPSNMKYVKADDVMPAIPRLGIPAFPIRKGEMVFWSPYVMARMSSVWGEDCEAFKPERFLDAEGRLKQYSQFQFNSFNSGPRLCLGKTLATFEGMAVTAEILGRWTFSLAPGTVEPRFAGSLTLPIKNPYSVGMRPRQSAS